MKMIPGTGDISDYRSYTSNCTLKQKPYRIPVSSLSDVQLYIDIGITKPTVVQYELINTCAGGGVSAIAPVDYVIGQNKFNQWYGVFKSFTGVSPSCFVIAITIDDQIYFSEEYCIEDCAPLTLLKGCYGNLDAELSVDDEGIYFGVHAGAGAPLGDTSVTYQHQALIREAEVFLSAIKNTFKKGLTRNFRTEKEKLYQFNAEIIPEWYLSDIDAIFFRGEVYIDGVKWLINETQFEKIEDCFKQWKPSVTLRKNFNQSFTCEADPCELPPQDCCDPIVTSVSIQVSEESGESGESGGVTPVPPSPLAEVVIIQAVVDGEPVVTGTTEPVTGLTDGSTVVSCAAFAGVRVEVHRAGQLNPGIDPSDGSTYHTKILADDFITFSDPLVAGEFIYIETIP